jgi:outer membrane protein assembly factor BamB
MNRMISIVVPILASCLLFSNPCAADPWTKTFAGPDYGAFFAITPTPDGDVLAVGATNHLHVPPYSGDALLMKLTLDGEVLWERRWGGERYEQAVAVAPAIDGGYYVFGETDSYGAGDRDFFLLKTLGDGTPEWFRTYGGPGREWPYGMFPLANGDLLLYGFTTSDEGSVRRQYAVRVDSAGAVLWEHVRGELDEEIVLDALETADGSLVLCVSLDEDAGLVKLDRNANVLWSKRFALPGWQFASCLTLADGEEFLLAGFSMSEAPQRQVDTWLARCASTGDLLWEKAFGTPTSDDYAQVLLALGDGTYVIGELGNGMPLVCVDGAGSVLWSKLLAGSRVHAVRGIIELDGGDLLIAGLIQMVNGRSYDAILLRTEANGEATAP